MAHRRGLFGVGHLMRPFRLTIPAPCLGRCGGHAHKPLTIVCRPHRLAVAADAGAIGHAVCRNLAHVNGFGRDVPMHLVTMPVICGHLRRFPLSLKWFSVFLTRFLAGLPGVQARPMRQERLSFHVHLIMTKSHVFGNNSYT